MESRWHCRLRFHSDPLQKHRSDLDRPRDPCMRPPRCVPVVAVLRHWSRQCSGGRQQSFQCPFRPLEESLSERRHAVRRRPAQESKEPPPTLDLALIRSWCSPSRPLGQSLQRDPQMVPEPDLHPHSMKSPRWPEQ